jgi:hypothetical protein
VRRLASGKFLKIPYWVREKRSGAIELKVACRELRRATAFEKR